VKFGICGIGNDLTNLVEDHASVERLLEQGTICVGPMSPDEGEAILSTAERLFDYKITFEPQVKQRIIECSGGYPYLTQLIGKECVNKANQKNEVHISKELFTEVLSDIKSGRSFPVLETAYQKAIGPSPDRQLLLHLLAEQPQEHTLFIDDINRIFLKKARGEAEDLEIQYIDQLLPRLIDEKYGPVLRRVPEAPGVYEFVNPVFRLYVSLRNLK
jgi:hypothetical protein